MAGLDWVVIAYGIAAVIAVGVSVWTQDRR